VKATKKAKSATAAKPSFPPFVTDLNAVLDVLDDVQSGLMTVEMAVRAPEAYTALAEIGRSMHLLGDRLRNAQRALDGAIMDAKASA
jgi:hypothetical protein